MGVMSILDNISVLDISCLSEPLIGGLQTLKTSTALGCVPELDDKTPLLETPDNSITGHEINLRLS